MLVMTYATPYPDVNAMLQALFARVQAALGSRMVGMYLDGSLATGDFDSASDIDFVAVTRDPITPELFAELQAMHDALARLDSPWAIQIEGSYMWRQALRRYDPQDNRYPNIERGQGERLKWVHHDATWDLHRYVLRERGIILAGPDPKTLIDPVTPDHLRSVMLPNLFDWAARLMEHPEGMRARGYQSYTVLSLCRILYTLQFADVVSKKTAVGWAKEALDPQWTPLIERAWVNRSSPDGDAAAEDIQGTQDMIRYAIERGRAYQGE